MSKNVFINLFGINIINTVNKQIANMLTVTKRVAFVLVVILLVVTAPTHVTTPTHEGTPSVAWFATLGVAPAITSSMMWFMMCAVFLAPSRLSPTR